MTAASASPVTIAVDRRDGSILAGGPRERLLVGMLDLYGTLSRPVMQRGLYKACRLVGQAVWRAGEARIVLSDDAELLFPARDPYWNRMLLRSYEHEPEMARFLRRIAGIDYGFVDCGANIGYWSVFVAASGCGGGKDVLAIEASAATFALLARNAAPHAQRVRSFHRAILDRSGLTVTLNDATHEARGIAGTTDDPGGERVLSVSIDDLLGECGWDEQRRLVVKLDVEGVERQALAGMEKALTRDALVIYEDHGADPGHAMTRHLLEERAFEVRLLLDDGDIAIDAAAALDRYKTDRTRGYNLLAMRPGSQWPALLDGLA